MCGTIKDKDNHAHESQRVRACVRRGVKEVDPKEDHSPAPGPRADA